MARKKKEKVPECPKTMSHQHIWVKQDLGTVVITICCACGLVDDQEIERK